eukprot:gene22369-biopygen16242
MWSIRTWGSKDPDQHGSTRSIRMQTDQYRSAQLSTEEHGAVRSRAGCIFSYPLLKEFFQQWAVGGGVRSKADARSPPLWAGGASGTYAQTFPHHIKR